MSNGFSFGSIKGNSNMRYVPLVCFMGIMIAFQFVTEYYLSFTFADTYRVSLTFLIRAITGYCIGWLGGIVSAIADLLGGFLLYGGSMNPGITLTRFLQGFIVGLILYRKSGKTRIVIAAAIDNLVLNMVLGTFFLFSYTGKPYTVVTLTPRVVVSAVSFVVEVILLMSLLPKLLPVVRKLMDRELTPVSKPVVTPESTPEETQYQS